MIRNWCQIGYGDNVVGGTSVVCYYLQTWCVKSSRLLTTISQQRTQDLRWSTDCELKSVKYTLNPQLGRCCVEMTGSQQLSRLCDGAWKMLVGIGAVLAVVLYVW